MIEVSSRHFTVEAGEVKPVEFFHGNDNATVQGNSEGVDFWVSCFVKVPWSLDTPTQAQVDRLADHLSKLLGTVSAVTPALSFEFGVDVGEDVDDFGEED